MLNFGAFTDVFTVLILTPLKHKIRKLLRPKWWNSPLFRWCVKTSWTSNIPGNPYAMDALSTIIAGPFPSLVDHNACMPCLSLPVILKGKPPAVGRYWSIQVFLKEAATVFNDRSGGNSKTESDSMRRNQTLKDVDMKIDKDGYFRLAIGDFGEGEGETPATNVIRTTSKSGLLVMRCFKVKEGTSWLAPNFHSVDDTEEKYPWPVDYQVRDAGPYATANGPTSTFERIKPLLLLNGALITWKPDLSRVVVLGAMLSKCMWTSIKNKFEKKYLKLKFPDTCVLNETVTKVSGLGGNADHIYWTFCYDCKEYDVELEGVLQCKVGSEDGFRYINLQCYNWDSLPINGFLDDESLRGEAVVPTFSKKLAMKKKSTATSTSSEEAANVTRKFKAYLTTEPSYEGANEIDVSSAVFGTATLRLLLPENDDVEKICLPKIRAVKKGFRV
ncbi:hypothetical protein TrLO_g15004 [Triparma laevis f. longispina]|uniref:Uncharacterized protein n=1 Tax=Triparma laevis f. longispina TaxID=1714387 RepID=A0A9W7CEK2_9STRA|nr:hypothetical protein TrLO_g15004 [Triparma laevis f. longispina]